MKNEDRSDLIHRILTKTLTSKSSDPGAGLGIQRALKAAKKMSCFVSLRTGEFWLTQSFTRPDTDPSLVDVKGATRARVAGTHWQFIWPQPLQSR